VRAVVQRVQRGAVTVEQRTIGRIGSGLVVLVGVTHTDDRRHAQTLAHKIAHLRIFEDDAGKMNRSVLEVGGEALVISQFTLYADCRHGRRPSFTDAAQPELAAELIEQFTDALRAEGIQKVAGGVFGAMMLVEIHNDGPVTIVLDSDDL